MILYILGLILKTIYFLTVVSVLVLIFEKTRLFFSKRWCTCKVDLSGKVILITGGNTGLGFESAKILAKRGAKIIIASRNVAKSQAAARAIADASGNPNIEYKALDLSKLSSIKRFADDFNKTYDRLDVLINNAGLVEMSPTCTEDGIDTTFQINHVGPTYLTQLLKDKLIASKPSRIIFVSSVAHRFHMFDPNDITGKNKMNFWIRYATTKFCNILITRAMSKVLPEGVTVNACHPGMAKTEIWEVGPTFYKKIIYFFIDNLWKTSEECSQTIVHLAMAPSLAHVTGEYFDLLQPAKLWRKLNNETAEQLYRDTLRLIEDKVKNDSG